ncbi:hypothetical protein AC579_6889 [Pseudocercospora musae]|uniref:Uncharacterized protein n=1 Tax=Pseudocercospora musae TaxID=113226 RepID=A0A139IGM5_9PEZI|nr:hypothetical protein AC579_6889 [Pseudocercospora musae]
MTVSSGGAAGIGIGCTIAGILICGASFYLVGHRRRKLASDLNDPGRVEEEIPIGGEKAVRSLNPLQQNPINASDLLVTRRNTAASSSSSSSDDSLGNATDTETKEIFHRLNVAIRSHAGLYYTTSSEIDPSQSCDANFSTLESILGTSAPVDAVAMDTLLQAPKTRIDAIRLLIAWAVFKYIQPDAEIERTLLPPEMVKCVQAMRRASLVENSQVRHSLPRKPVPGSGISAVDITTVTQRPDDHIAFAKWRETSGKLLQPVYGDGKVVGTKDPRDQNIGELVTILVCLLQPYVAKGYGGARVRDLENVVGMGAAFGYRLFTQRPEWEFAWSTLMADEIVVYPALVKIGDEKGKRLRKSIVLDWEEVVKVPEPMESVVSKRASVHKGVA